MLNNAQVRTIVFVEKRALTEALAHVADEMAPPANKDKGSGKSREQQKTEGLAKQSMEAQSKQTISNSEQKDTSRIWGTSKDHSPFLVKLALGDLVIVGDEIEYLQRVQVQSSAQTASAGSPITVSPSKLVFDNQAVGKTSAAQSVTVPNAGTAAVTGIAVSIAGTNKDEFVQTNTCGATLASGTNCSISVTFSPKEQGSRAATLSIAYNGPGSPLQVTLAGSAIVPILTTSVSTRAVTFAAQSKGTSSTAQSVTLTNIGASLTNLTISIGGTNKDDFSQSSTCGASVAAGGNCTISVIFKPGAIGNRTGTLIAEYDVSGSHQSQVVDLSGTGK